LYKTTSVYNLEIIISEITILQIILYYIIIPVVCGIHVFVPKKGYQDYRQKKCYYFYNFIQDVSLVDFEIQIST